MGDATLSLAERIVKWIVWGVTGGVGSTGAGTVLGFLTGSPLSGLVIGVVVGMVVLVTLAFRAVGIASRVEHQECSEQQTSLSQLSTSTPNIHIGQVERLSVGASLEASNEDTKGTAEAETQPPSETGYTTGSGYPVPQTLPSAVRSREKISDLSFRITDFVVGANYAVGDKVFENCTIHGPAIIFPSGCTFDGGGFMELPGDDLEPLLWEIGLGQEYAIGPMRVLDCVFRNCNLIGIGVTGRTELIQQMRDAFAESQEKED